MFENIKDHFPFFKNNSKLVFLDTAASAQKPQSVIDSINQYYSKENSNVHRGIHQLSQKATDAYELVRENFAINWQKC